jgi:hypothetical protein
MVALTAVLQAGDRLPTLVCKHCSASLPPGVTPEHFDMKSDRQAPRMALCCLGVTWAVTWAVAAVANAANATVVANARDQRLGRIMVPPLVSPHFA